MNSPYLVLLRVITRRSWYCDRPGDLGVNEIAMATLATAIDKSGSQEVSYQFSDLWRHVWCQPRRSHSSLAMDW